MIWYEPEAQSSVSALTYWAVKLPSCRPTQDCTLFDIGCETFLYHLINDCINSFCSYFCFMFRKSREKCQKVQEFDDFRYFCYFHSRCALSKECSMELKLWQYSFFTMYQQNFTQRYQFSRKKNSTHPIVYACWVYSQDIASMYYVLFVSKRKKA